MNILKKILYFLLGLLILFYVFAIVCILNPDISKAVAKFLYPDSESNSVQVAAADIDSNIPELDYDNNGRSGIDEAESADWRDQNEGLEQGITSDYIPPEQSELVIPENVSGRNGYQEIQDDQEQIDEDTAEELQRQLDTGNTGDGLEFNALYYPYYAMLNEKGQHIYRQIYANGNDLYQAFAPVEAVTARELRNIFSAVYNDHPELFWMETAYSGKYVRSGQCVEIDLRFNRTARNLESAKSLFDENANQILSGAQNLSDNYEQEKYVHDALIDRITYNMGAEMNQSAYSALVNGQTVCAGYARAFQYLMQQLEIPCYYCTGFAGESHAWNIIMLDDDFYNVDTTWDDTGNGTYDYFNKTDADYASSHIRRDLSVYLPPCNGQKYRNLEPEEETETAEAAEIEQIEQIEEIENMNLRSFEDTGLTAEKIFNNMQDYYNDCYDQMLQHGRGEYTFYNVIEGDDLIEEWYQNYQNDHYKQAYMEDAMTQVGASACEIMIEVEELQGGRYLIRHELYVR